MNNMAKLVNLNTAQGGGVIARGDGPKLTAITKGRRNGRRRCGSQWNTYLCSTQAVGEVSDTAGYRAWVRRDPNQLEHSRHTHVTWGCVGRGKFA